MILRACWPGSTKNIQMSTRSLDKDMFVEAFSAIAVEEQQTPKPTGLQFVVHGEIRVKAESLTHHGLATKQAGTRPSFGRKGTQSFRG